MSSDFNPWTAPIVIGGGVLHVNGRDLGNCSQVRLGAKYELARHPDYSSKVRRWGKVVISHRGHAGSFLTDSMTAANIALWVSGATNATLVFVGATVFGVELELTLSSATIVPAGETDFVTFDKTQELGFTFEGTLQDPQIIAIRTV